MTPERVRAENNYARAVLDHYKLWLDGRASSPLLAEEYIAHTQFQIPPEKLLRLSTKPKRKPTREASLELPM